MGLLLLLALISALPAGGQPPAAQAQTPSPAAAPGDSLPSRDSFAPGDSLLPAGTRAPADSSPPGETPAPGDSSAVVPPGAAGASADSLPPAGIPGAPRARIWWEDGWALGRLPSPAARLLVDRNVTRRSSALTFSDVLWNETSLGVDRAGVHGAWEIPYRIGSGVERLSLWLGGASASGAGIPEAGLPLTSPLHVGRVSFVAPDPFLDPLGGGGDGLIWAEEPLLDWSRSSSGVRLTEGPTAAASQEIFLGRETGPWRLFGNYGHFSSEGRPVWLFPRYSGIGEQNARLALDRAMGGSGWRLQVSNRVGKTVLEGNRKFAWEAREILAQGLVHVAGLSGQVSLGRTNDGLRWEDGGENDRRLGHTTRALARLAAPLGSWSLLFAGGGEIVDLRLKRAPYDVDLKSAAGKGASVGFTREGARGALLVDAGWVDPWWGKAHARGHALVSIAPLPRLRATVEGWTDELAPFIARADGDPRALLDEGVLRTAGERVDAGPLRRVTHGEARCDFAAGGSRVEAGAFVRRLEHALGTDPAQAALLAPAERDLVDPVTLEGSLQLTGVFGEAEIGLPYGLRLFGDGVLLVDPAAGALPAFTSRAHGRGGVAWAFNLFRGDLFFEARLLGLYRDAIRTPYGELDALGRLDGEIEGTVMRQAHVFLATRNLLNDDQPSLTYTEDGWMLMPFQHTEIGVEWHFFE